jgi:hypothetical protein
MDNQVWQNFYHRTLTLYPPQAEKFLDSAPTDTFNQISFRYTFSVEAMIKISYIIENAAMANPGVANFHASFQYLSRVLPQQARYAKISQHSRGLWLYGVPNSDGIDKLFPRATLIDTTDSFLVNYWFVVAYGPGIGMSLLAEEISALAGTDRYYEGFYTFDQDIAYQLIAILHRIYPQQVPQPLPPEQLTNT